MSSNLGTESTSATAAAEQDLLRISNLHVVYQSRGRKTAPVRAVDGVTFHVGPRETVGLVGESGSGKSTIGRAMLGLAPVDSGSIVLKGHDITHSKAGDRRHIATDLQVIFQDPYGSMNPSRTVGRTLAEPLEATGAMTGRQAAERIQSLLDRVRLPGDAAYRYPHAFSGGQRQRIAIARALAVDPELVVCDEAISALDVVTQAQVLNLLAQLQRETGVGYLFIAHNLPVVSYFSDRVIVLYRGRIMEEGDAIAIHDRPFHPYSQALRAAVPVPNVAEQAGLRRRRRELVRVSTAEAVTPPDKGCPFAPRCPHAAEVCWTTRPADVTYQQRTLACHVFDPTSGHPRCGAADELAAGTLSPDPTQ